MQIEYVLHQHLPLGKWTVLERPENRHYWTQVIPYTTHSKATQTLAKLRAKYPEINNQFPLDWAE